MPSIKKDTNKNKKRRRERPTVSDDTIFERLNPSTLQKLKALKNSDKK